MALTAAALLATAFLRGSLTALKILLLVGVVIALVILVIGNTMFRGDRDIAYRFAAPDAPECMAQESMPIALSSEVSNRDNDELAAIERQPVLGRALTCMVQVHQVEPPRDKPALGALRYYLGFLEFAENGSPADTDAQDRVLRKRQLDALVAHLREQRKLGKHSYVIAFVHGWRHNAGIGDGDVAKLRLMAAYTASFLRQRCVTLQRDCNTVVTAVYFGWRGARIDERAASRMLGPRIGQYFDAIFGTPPALLTLFDRKPVSERIGPAAVTALRRIDAITFDRHGAGWKRDPQSRMIVFGHSLGGNMLATALREPMLDRIARHVPGAAMTAPFADLIVLLNPASEASNWTVLQRAMRERVRFLYPMREANVAAEIEHDAKEIAEGHKFYPVHQPPVYVTLGSANTWPAGGIRRADVKYLHRQIFGERPLSASPTYAVASATPEAADAMKACREMLRRREILDRPHYDWATHDLFPAFRFDFRAAADTLEEIAKGGVSDDICRLNDPNAEPGEETEEPSGILRGAAAFLRNFPFMNTDVEQTRTIGNLIPLRSPIGTLGSGGILPSTVYGTTHELTFNLGNAAADFMLPSYRMASDLAYTECAVVDHWLWRARQRVNNNMNWDSGYTAETLVQDDPPNLLALRDRPTLGGGRMESRFRHGLAHSGMAPIVRGNDPFWNVRVFETGMRDHDGYTSYPLMCAIQQLVMDRIADPVPVPAVVPPATSSGPPAVSSGTSTTPDATSPSPVPTSIESPAKAP
ncbi:MAG: hypothetical protein WCE79_16435 [Xanthobacteraceae bacterium]